MLARELDLLVDDATRPAWSSWLVARFAGAKHRPKTSVDSELYRRLSELLPPDRFAPAAAKPVREQTEKMIANGRVPPPAMMLVAAASDPEPLFDRIVDRARVAGEQRDAWIEALGYFPAAFAKRVAALAVDKAELPVEPIWSALHAYFARPASRTAAWQALRDHLATLEKRMPHRANDLVDAAASLCDRTSRDEVAKTFAHRARVARVLDAIDSCIARRDKLGDLSAALAASR